MRNRMRCLLKGHDWPEYSAWIHGGRTKYYRQRFCRRCGRQQLDLDG